MEYAGKAAVVTGAGSGIGRALVTELARRGADVAASDVDKVGLDETVELCGRAGGKVRPYALDVSDREAMLAHADDVMRDFGRVDLMVNNAGVALAASVLESSFEDIDWLLGINLFGVINGTKAFLPHLVASGDGHLVNISSVFGLIGVPTQSAYCTAKFGVRGFTESLRLEMIAESVPVGVHCVHPGGIRTNIARNARVDPSVAQRSADPGKDFDRVARTTPAKAATKILKGVDKGSPRILIGTDAYVIEAIPRLFGAHYQGAFGRLARLGIKHAK